MSILKTTSGATLLDGVSCDLYGGTRLLTRDKTIGIGISKEVLNIGNVLIGGGLYVTKPLKKFFNGLDNVNVGFGITGSLRF